MKTIRIPSIRMTIVMFFTTLVLISSSCSNPGPINGQTFTPTFFVNDTGLAPETPPPGKKIQLALLLDTSNSMDGLIEQAKSTLWKFVNALSATSSQGQKPELDIALYEYGNDGLSEETNYIRQVSAFTGELDEISEQLFALSTNGGSEYCGAVIGSSLNNLQWTSGGDDLKIIFIAGNEPFDQGPIDYKKVCAEAREKDVIVNTIFCGEQNEGRKTHWQSGATSANGTYMSIDHNAATVYVETPFDDKIDSLNTMLNNTYIYYGSQGYTKFEKQRSQDDNADKYGKANKAERSVSKASSFYSNKSWDLVDASDEKGFDLNKIQNSELPKELQSLNIEQKTEYINIRKEQRKLIRIQINDINKLRTDYITANSANDAGKSLDVAMLQAIRQQATDKGFQVQ